MRCVLWGRILLAACGGFVPFIGPVSLAFHMNIHQALLVGTFSLQVWHHRPDLLEMGKLKPRRVYYRCAVIDDVLELLSGSGYGADQQAFQA